MMSELKPLLSSIPWLDVGLTALTVLIGYALARVFSYLIGRQVERRINQTSGMIARRLVFWGLLGFALVVVLREMNVSLGALLAAGGLFGVALGFASQTAVSNVISGLFLIFERPFEVGDAIRVDNQFGMVESIDLLSTKIRTFDNLLWRMPNEKLLKSDIYNITRYDIRRMDVAASISYADNIERAREVLLETAEEIPNVLGHPEPITRVESMGESGIDLTLRFWFERPDFVTVISEVTERIKVNLEEAGLTIPFPHRTVYVRNEEQWQDIQPLNQQRQDPAESDRDDSDLQR
ncbi:MAG: mechanosensitive ion channel family protein [bacterium]